MFLIKHLCILVWVFKVVCPVYLWVLNVAYSIGGQVGKCILLLNLLGDSYMVFLYYCQCFGYGCGVILRMVYLTCCLTCFFHLTGLFYLWLLSSIFGWWALELHGCLGNLVFLLPFLEGVFGCVHLPCAHWFHNFILPSGLSISS